MILDQILYKDYTPGVSAYMLETPAHKDYLPSIVSNTRGGFVISRKLTSDSKLRSGFFEIPKTGIDFLLPSMFEAAFSLSEQESWDNRFSRISEAFSHILECAKASGFGGQPHILLFPDSWGEEYLFSICEDGDLSRPGSDLSIQPWIYKNCAKIIFCNVTSGVFLSRPDCVGLQQSIGGYSSIILHNIEFGMSFLGR